MRNFSIVAVLIVALAASGGCTKPPKKEVGQGGAGGRGATGAQPGDTTGAGGRGERGTVSSEAAKGLKPIYFDFDKYNLRDDARATLNANADVLLKNSDMKIRIEGNCDERGTVEYNLALGERRAKAAQDYLVKVGVPAARITIISFGEERPVAIGHDEESWRQNRRDDFTLQ